MFLISWKVSIKGWKASGFSHNFVGIFTKSGISDLILIPDPAEMELKRY